MRRLETALSRSSCGLHCPSWNAASATTVTPYLDEKRHDVEEERKRSLGERIAVPALKIRAFGVRHPLLDLVSADRRARDGVRECMCERRLKQ